MAENIKTDSNGVKPFTTLEPVEKDLNSFLNSIKTNC